MNRLHFPARKAFTLIELLVVVTIIAILASLGFVAIQSALLNAQKAKARNDLAQIVGGVTAFFTEYGRYPIDATAQTGGDAACIYGSNVAGNTARPNSLIFNVLTYPTWATEDQKALNPRQVKFLEIPPVKSAASPTSGIVTTGSGATRGCWFDPWGFQYVIFIDGDYASDIAWGGAAAGNNGPYSSIGTDTTGVAPISVGAACIGLYATKPTTGSPIVPGPNSAATVPKHAFSRAMDMVSWQ